MFNLSKSLKHRDTDQYLGMKSQVLLLQSSQTSCHIVGKQSSNYWSEKPSYLHDHEVLRVAQGWRHRASQPVFEQGAA
jgi:hypothetical protein